jgi:sulfhydrogenase subunit beta (sulfur reductase)
MSVSFIRDGDFSAFVASLIAGQPVYGPVAKRTRFVFGQLASPDQLRLDYDVTILPPKKLFFPTAQELLRFDGDRFQAVVEPVEKVLLGVHFYDVKAIDMTDRLFTERHPDINYLAHRQTTTIVATNPQRASIRAFWASMGREVEPRGHDAFLTKLGGGYVLEARTARGEALLAHGAFTPATETQISEAARVNAEAMKLCPETMKLGSGELAEAAHAAFGKDKLWERLAEDCFSCGCCNVVCPTCYCFDVQDTWNVDQKSGSRTRYWDACLTEPFAEVSLGGGNTENFRDDRWERYRHRIMRKLAYLNGKLGGPACVGCGRCSLACKSDIADPVKTVDQIMAAEER